MTTNAILNDEMIGNLENTIDEINNELKSEPSGKEKLQSFFKENGWDLLSAAIDIYWIFQQIFITRKWKYEKHSPIITFLVTGGRNKREAEIFCGFGAGVKTVEICASIGKIIARCIK